MFINTKREKHEKTAYFSFYRYDVRKWLNALTLAELEARLIAAEGTISAMNSHLSTIDTQITELQSFHNTREFTVTDTLDTVKDFTEVEFSDKITSLNFTDGEWLYVKMLGDMSFGQVNTIEICTSDSRLTSQLGVYVSPKLTQERSIKVSVLS